ncbi:MAG: tRNA (adenosine(37)-N6)-threonylcarbamoyltransferase complex ATPase subunit type 1 TsaE [Acidobacteriota bacterium]
MMRRIDEVSGQRSWMSASEAETEEVGERLAALMSPHAVLLLSGDMGSGKTVLVRGLARALGVERREIQSPTYTLIHEHEGAAGRLVHADLYRLEPDDIAGLGLEEILAGRGLKAIEWPDRLPVAPRGALRVEITAREDGRRQIELLGG